jgi:hypothetical protein
MKINCDVKSMVCVLKDAGWVNMFQVTTVTEATKDS